MSKTNHFGLAQRWRTAVAGLAGSLALSATLAVTPASAADPVKAQVFLDQPTVLAGGNAVVYVVLRFEGLGGNESGPRPPLNVALVLDRSGSMSDAGKIDYLKKAAKLAVDRLGENDTLSIVSSRTRGEMRGQPPGERRVAEHGDAALRDARELRSRDREDVGRDRHGLAVEVPG